MSRAELPNLSPDDAASELQRQTNKRLSLNLLIQGAAAHAFISASHLVRDELEAIRPGLTELYDKFAIAGQLNYCIGDVALLCGRPNRWLGLSGKPQKAFRNHLLLATRANQLAREETSHLRQLAREKHLKPIPVVIWWQMMRLFLEVSRFEKGREPELEPLAIRVASLIWGLPEDRMDGQLTRNVAFGHLQPDRSRFVRLLRAAAAGYGGVELRSGRFTVVAKAWVFPLLVHELVKGTAELVCLHGLCDLDEPMYHAVTSEADRLEYEAWMLQAGPAMWRRLLSVLPRDMPLSRILMRIARLDPMSLEELLLQVIDDPPHAARQLQQLT
jgi:hypothetical protein